MAAHVRLAMPADNAPAREIVRTSLGSYGLAAEFDGPTAVDAAIGALGRGENAVDLVASHNNEVVGCVCVASPDSAGNGKLFGFHVAARAQGYGLGRELLSRTICEARRLGLSSLTLDTLQEMRAAIHLYESLGWKLDTAATAADGSGADRTYVLSLQSACEVDATTARL